MIQAFVPTIGPGPIIGPPVLFAPPASSVPKTLTQLATQGVASVERKVAVADREVRAFALDDGVPVHRVSYALQQARLSLELALQVRTRLLDAYQQLMNMQL